MKHGTVRVVHYDEISAGGSVSGRETDPSALSCPYTGTDDGMNERYYGRAASPKDNRKFGDVPFT